jgi:uncharacterized membrane protein YGL010W
MHPLLAEYGTFHEDKRNQACHEVGIPLIVLAIVALVRRVKVGRVDLALPLIGALAVFYARLARAAALFTIFALFAFYALAAFIAWPLALALFVVGWIFQFVGHAYEGKRPAFLGNLVHLLVGPLWIGVKLVSKRA